MAHYADNRVVWTYDLEDNASDDAVVARFPIPANREAKILKAYYLVGTTDAGVSLEVVQGSTVLAEVSIAGSANDVNEDTSSMPVTVSSSTSNQCLKLTANGAIDTGRGTFVAVITW